MLLEVCIVVWEYIGRWKEIKVFAAKLLLHSIDVLAQPIFLSDLIHLGENVDSLIFVETLKGIILTMLRSPQNIPVGHAVGVSEAIGIENLMY